MLADMISFGRHLTHVAALARLRIHYLSGLGGKGPRGHPIMESMDSSIGRSSRLGFMASGSRTCNVC